MNHYVVYREQDFSADTTNDIYKVFTEAFLKNPMIGDYFFNKDRKKIFEFIKTTIKFYIKLGHVFVCKNESGDIVAAAALGLPGTKPLSVKSVIKNGFLPDFIKFFFTVGIKDAKKVLSTGDILEKNHFKDPHFYLYMLASVEKGAGRVLFNKVIDSYSENTIFFESSVTKNDHEYYKSFGAKPIGEIFIGGVSNMLFVIKNSEDLIGA